MEKLTKLFEPGEIGKIKVKNRIIMAPVGFPLGTTHGYTTERQIAFYEARAKGGVGLIEVTTAIPGPIWGPRVMTLMDDGQIPSAQRLVRALQAYGVKVSFSVSHPGVRVSEALEKRPPETHPELVPIVAPSAIRHPLVGRLARALDKDEIAQLIEIFVQAARRGKSAGFDLIRIQASHGYLVHQFLSPRTNKRKDEYGGSVEKRCRFAYELIRQVRAEVGPDFPILFRMNGEDFLDDGISLDEGVEQACIIADAGVDAIDVTTGPRESHHWQFVTMYQPSGPVVRSAKAIKKAVKLPVSVSGKIDPLLAERILQEGSADFIHLCRPLIADPELPNKAREGRLEEIRPCIYCNHCWGRRILVGDELPCCAVNPGMAKEREFKLEPAPRAKKVIVIGGGMAGMEAATTLAQRGHEVSLYEKSDRLGGQWNILSAYRPEQDVLVKYMSRELEKAGVTVFLGQEVTCQKVMEAKPDAVVAATGAKPALPDVPGIDHKKVVQAVDVLAGKVRVGQEVVVIGGHLVGLDAALFLAEQGKKVSVIEKLKIAWGINTTIKLALMENLIKYGVYLYPDSTLERVTENGVYIIWDSGDAPVKGGDRYETLFLKADTVVLAIGSRTENRLGEELSGYMPEVYAIGDCVEPRDVLAAIHEGSALGRKI